MKNQKIKLSQLIKESAETKGFYKTQTKELIENFLFKIVIDHLTVGEEVDVGIGILFLDKAKIARKDGVRRTVIRFRSSPTLIRKLSGESNKYLKTWNDRALLFKEKKGGYSIRQSR